MAEDDSGVIFGNPDIGVGFGNPDSPNPIGFGFPTKVAKVRKCATVIRCPGEDFLNYSTECDDVDYAGGTILKCLDQATPIDFFVKSPGIGPWTWDVQNLPDGVMFLVNDFCPSLLNIFGILTSDQTTTTIITVTDGFGNVTVMKITFSTSTVGPCHIVDPTPIICTEEPCPGPGDSFTIDLCGDGEQTYTIPSDATPEQVLAIQQQAADAFYRSLLTCRLTPPPPSPPPPNLLWYNQSQTWTDTCPDGSFFFYTVGANKYASNTLLNANTKALLAAKKQADKLFLCIDPPTLPDGNPGAPYSQQLTATNGHAPYTFTIDSGSLPTGLTMTLAGLISGTPTTSGAFPFVVKAVDSGNPNKQATKSYTITIDMPTFLTLSMPASPTPVILATFDASFNSKWKLFKNNAGAAQLVGTAAGSVFTVNTGDTYFIASSQTDADDFWVTGGNLVDRVIQFGQSSAGVDQIQMNSLTSPPGTYGGFAPSYEWASSNHAGEAFQLPLTVKLAAATAQQAAKLLEFSVTFTDITH